MAIPKQPRRGMFHIQLKEQRAEVQSVGEEREEQVKRRQLRRAYAVGAHGRKSNMCLIHSNNISSSPLTWSLLSASHGLVGSLITVQGDSVQVSAQLHASSEG